MGNVRLDYKFHFFEDLRAVVEAGIDRFDSSGHTGEYSKCFRFSAKVFNDVGYVNLGNTLLILMRFKIKLKCLF
jgi:iron complex outermembrane receptor protein